LAQLGRAQPGVQKDFDDGPVTVGRRALMGKRPAICRFSFARGLACLDHYLDLLARQWVYFCLLMLGRWHIVHRVGDLKLPRRPSEERRQHGPYVTDRLWRQRLVVLACDPARDIARAQVGKVGPRVLGRDVGDGAIALIRDPLMQLPPVAVNRAQAASLGFL
jgi:hypothetical protein